MNLSASINENLILWCVSLSIATVYVIYRLWKEKDTPKITYSNLLEQGKSAEDIYSDWYEKLTPKQRVKEDAVSAKYERRLHFVFSTLGRFGLIKY
ncbi:hypothetical protein HC723_11815 [Vibrio sp. S11_S32]|uniref:hypothetical protein n=1 Tax=Vibrio sp. S11_S32 TaxID=2720225 RepID=UPI001680A7A0|nr:hypothetical protein [Vibrio sp. S11_S32]MBD1577119.1 hypothetical protein [Vibrio sp. S11_S32]